MILYPIPCNMFFGCIGENGRSYDTVVYPGTGGVQNNEPLLIFFVG